MFANGIRAENGGAMPTASQMDGQYSGALSDGAESMIADEVRLEFATLREGGYRDVAPAGRDYTLSALDPSHRVLVVSSDFTVSAGGGVCVLTPGDALCVTTHMRPPTGRWVWLSRAASPGNAA